MPEPPMLRTTTLRGGMCNNPPNLLQNPLEFSSLSLSLALPLASFSRGHLAPRRKLRVDLCRGDEGESTARGV